MGITVSGGARRVQPTKLDLLEDKLSLILRMRDLTESAELTGNGAEERYIDLITRREAIVKQLRALDASLSGYAREEGEDRLLTLISKASAEVLEMENELDSRVPDLMNGIKDRLKRIKDGRNINRAYQASLFGTMGAGTYDLTK